ncbi:parapinopsin a [Amia ocellicauda]|uniref:parapinopsin a n=1 Tax=Amia ocellicauda TaxID=2972642 RepID=UPI0034638DBF
MPRIGYTMLAFIMAVFSTAAIILNSTVILVTIRYRQLRHPINYSLVNLAVADLGVSLSGGLMTVVTNAMGYFSLGRTGCVIEGFAVAFFGIAGLCTVAVIAVDRFIVVCKPLGMVMFRTKHAVMGVVSAWVWSFVWNTPPLLGWGSYQLEGVGTSCAPDWYNRDPANVSYIICYFALCFAAPFSMIVFSYSHLLWTLNKVSRLGVAKGGTTAKAEVQVARMVILMVLAFLLCWLPYAAFAMAVIFNPRLHINPIVATVPMYMTKTSTVYNPLIYIFMNRQFRDCAVPFLLCGRNPWAADPEGAEEDTSISTINRSNNQVAPT